MKPQNKLCLHSKLHISYKLYSLYSYIAILILPSRPHLSPLICCCWSVCQSWLFAKKLQHFTKSVYDIAYKPFIKQQLEEKEKITTEGSVKKIGIVSTKKGIRGGGGGLPKWIGKVFCNRIDQRHKNLEILFNFIKVDKGKGGWGSSKMAKEYP